MSVFPMLVGVDRGSQATSIHPHAEVDWPLLALFRKLYRRNGYGKLRGDMPDTLTMQRRSDAHGPRR